MATMEAPPRLQVRLHQGPFVNEPPVNFRNEENARKMRSAIEKVRGQLGREYDLIIGGKRVKTGEKIKTLNPARPSQIVGVHQKAGREHVEPAMNAALKAFEWWSRTSIEERASLVFRVGDLLRERKYEFMAWLVFEVSKNWAEADGDIAETIDFCGLYAREALRLSKAQPVRQLPGQRDHPFYLPPGLGARSPPLEFPLRHHGRHDLGLHRVRQHCHPEAVERLAHRRGEVCGTARRGRHARGRGELLPRFGRKLRRCHRFASEDALHRFHRTARSRITHQPERCYAGAGTDLDQAHHP